jgi:hypothetical protein
MPNQTPAPGRCSLSPVPFPKTPLPAPSTFDTDHLPVSSTFAGVFFLSRCHFPPTTSQQLYPVCTFCHFQRHHLAAPSTFDIDHLPASATFAIVSVLSVFRTTLWTTESPEHPESGCNVTNFAPEKGDFFLDFNRRWD